MLKRKAATQGGKTKKSMVSKRTTNPSVARTIYNGPIITKKDTEATRCVDMVLYQVQTLTSTVGGVINNVIAGNPSSAANWADTNTVFGEYRLLGFKVTFKPWNRYSKTTTVCTPLVCLIDRRNSSALASFTAALGKESAQWKSIEDPWSVAIKMAGPEEANFTAVSGPTAFQWFKLYGENLSANTTYGYLEIAYRVQFRNIE